SNQKNIDLFVSILNIDQSFDTIIITTTTTTTTTTTATVECRKQLMLLKRRQEGFQLGIIQTSDKAEFAKICRKSMFKCTK
ncbi:hypothetical protein BpHYR1_009271, partial [Brachionus plicatilis]